MLLNVIFITMIFCCSGIAAMELPVIKTDEGKTNTLPADIIRKIVRFIPGAKNWTDSEQVFALQSMAAVNRHWNASMQRLTALEFPYSAS